MNLETSPNLPIWNTKSNGIHTPEKINPIIHQLISESFDYDMLQLQQLSVELQKKKIILNNLPNSSS